MLKKKTPRKVVSRPSAGGSGEGCAVGASFLVFILIIAFIALAISMTN